MKKKIIMTISLLAIIMASGGCLSIKGKKPEPQKTIKIGIIYSDKDQGSIYKEIAKDFEQKNKNLIKVDVITDYGNQEKVKSSLTDKNDLDLVGLKRCNLIEYAKQGLIHDISGMLADSGLNNRLYKISLAYGQYNNKSYGIGDLPMSMEWFYNPAILSRYNITPPKTRDELINASKKLKANGIIPIGIGEIDGFTLPSLLGMITSQTTKSVDFTNAYGSQMSVFKDINGMSAAFKVLKKISDSAILSNSDQVNYRQSVQDFVDGHTAFLPAGSFATALINKIKPSGFNYSCLTSNITFVENPNSLYSATAGQVLTIAANSKNINDAIKFLKFAFSEDEQKKFKQAGFVSAVKSVNSSDNQTESIILNHIGSSDINSIMLMDNIDNTMLDSLTSVIKDVVGDRVVASEAWDRVLKNTYRQ